MDINRSAQVQHLNNDGSTEIDADWDTFSFESELENRKKIINEYMHSFDLYAKSTTPAEDDESVIIQCKENKDVQCELLKENEVTLTKYENLINEYKNVRERIDKLTLRNQALEKSIRESEEKESELQKDYQLQKIALQKGIEMYTTSFDLDININNISDSIYEASVNFSRESHSKPVTFRVDRVKRRVLDFDTKEILTPSEESDIKKRFDDFENLPGLLCVLRDIVLSKQSMDK